MATLDLVILVLTAIGAVSGFVHGFIRQLGSILGFIVGLLAARKLYDVVAEKMLPWLDDSVTLAQVISFVAIWLAVPILFAFVSSLLTKAIETVSLGWCNRWLGSGLGALKALLVCCLLVGILEYVDRDNRLVAQTMKSDSVLYYPMKEVTSTFLPLAKELTQQYIL